MERFLLEMICTAVDVAFYERRQTTEIHKASCEIWAYLDDSKRAEHIILSVAVEHNRRSYFRSIGVQA